MIISFIRGPARGWLYLKPRVVTNGAYGQKTNCPDIWLGISVWARHTSGSDIHLGWGMILARCWAPPVFVLYRAIGDKTNSGLVDQTNLGILTSSGAGEITSRISGAVWSWGMQERISYCRGGEERGRGWLISDICTDGLNGVGGGWGQAGARLRCGDKGWTVWRIDTIFLNAENVETKLTTSWMLIDTWK